MPTLGEMVGERMGDWIADPSLAAYTSLLKVQSLKEKAHRAAQRREEENAQLAEADKTPTYELLDDNGVLYVAEIIREAFCQADTWMGRTTAYNSLFAGYLSRKAYLYSPRIRYITHTLNLKQFKRIAEKEGLS